MAAEQDLGLIVIERDISGCVVKEMKKLKYGIRPSDQIWEAITATFKAEGGVKYATYWMVIRTIPRKPILNDYSRNVSYADKTSVHFNHESVSFILTKYLMQHSG